MSAPWNANEFWEFGEDERGRFARVTGRQRCPDELKKDIKWWFRNDYEQQVEDATWYHPEWPDWRRRLYWNYFRNPLQNARLFVWGVADQNYTIRVLEGDPDPLVVQRNDLIPPEKGYQRSRIYLEDGTTRDFVSYCGDHVVWYSGTQPSGIWGAKFNFV